jgi:hypothetical protein
MRNLFNRFETVGIITEINEIYNFEISFQVQTHTRLDVTYININNPENCFIKNYGFLGSIFITDGNDLILQIWSDGMKDFILYRIDLTNDTLHVWEQ